ncbi:MAG: PAS domain S-box-containing protein, partial [Haloarculaceae archaeon]
PVAVTDGVRDLFDGAPQIDAEDGVPAWEAYATDEPKIVQDMNVAEFAGVSEVPIESGLHFPVGDEGVLTIASPATNAFDPGDVDLARVLATTVDAAMERVARQQELTLKDRAMDESNIGIVITDPSQPDNPIIYANEGFTRLTGYTKSEVLGENCRFLQGEDTDPETVATMREAIDQDRPTSVEVLNYRKDGTPFWSQVEIMPVRDDEGEVTNYLGFQRGVTERVTREQELQRVKERFQRVFEQSTDAIVLVDVEDDELLEVNQAACEMLGYDREELLALGAEDIYPEDTEDRREAFRSQVRETGAAYTSDVPCVTSRGEIVPTEISGALLTSDATDQPSTMVAIVRDISDRVVYEKELERQNERLEKFASTVAHDLRNPLSVAEGYLKVAQETGETDVLDDLGDAHGRMRSIITDLLTAAREGTTVTDVEAVDLSNLVERAWGTVSTHDSTLVADDLGMEFEADEDRLRQVLENLFRNAIDHGGEDVTVTLERLPDGFAVADDGPGIPAADREDVFEYGYSTSEDGSGYGLAITTDLVEAHGWTVTVTESDAGGARFEISGIGLQTDPHRPETARPDGSGLQH